MVFCVIALGTLTGGDTADGGLAMGAVSFMPIGAILGAAVGLWFGGKIAKMLPLAAVRILAAGIPALCLLTVGGYFIYQDLTDGNPYSLDRPRPVVNIEIRLPYKVAHRLVDPFYRKAWVSYDCPHGRVSWDKPRARDEATFTVLRLKRTLYYRVPNRKLRFWRKEACGVTVFDLNLPEDPRPTPNYGPWVETGNLAIRTKIEMQS